MAENQVLEGAGEKAGALLQKKYAGIPFWIWLGILGGAAFVARKFIVGSNKAEVVPSGDAAPADKVYGPDGEEIPVGYTPTGGRIVYGGTPGLGGSNVNTPTADNSILNTSGNQAWLDKAVGKLRDLNLFDNMRVDVALRRYISGYRITDPLDARIVATAIQQNGTPPQVLGTDEFIQPEKSSEVKRFVRNAGDGGVVAELADGTIIGVTSWKEWQQIRDQAIANESPIPEVTLASTDPFWNRWWDQQGARQAAANAAA